jgi:allantoinase
MAGCRAGWFSGWHKPSEGVTMKADLVVRGGTLVFPHGRVRADLVIREGRIVGHTAPGEAEGKEIVEADGLYVLPGGVDAHVHMQDPGLTDREDFITGTGAAVVGGVTTVIDHHRTIPFVLRPEIVREKTAYLASRARVDYALLGGAHPDNIDQLRPMWEAGVVGFKVFTCNLHGVPAALPDKMLEIFRTVASFDGVCLVHAEDEFITRANEERLRAAGRKDFRVIPEWRTLEAELVAVNTVVFLARLTGCRVVIAHVSHPRVCEVIRRERSLGARVWAESCPQYFHLSTDEIDRWGTWHKFTPPAREREAAEAMWARLEAGEIDMICSDHAPATRADKERGLEDIWACSFGIPCVETALPLMLTGVNEGRISLERLVMARSQIPAQVYGLWPRKGGLHIGADADFVLVDLTAERILRDEDMVSKAGWTPYAGRRVRGLPVRTYVRGRLVAAEGKPVGEPGWGQFLPGPGFSPGR